MVERGLTLDPIEVYFGFAMPYNQTLAAPAVWTEASFMFGVSSAFFRLFWN